MTGGARPPNATAASLLGFLHDGPMTGWDLVQTAEARIGGFWSLSPSQVYRELATMAQTGLIAAEARGPRERRPYRITPEGRAAFAAWVERVPEDETIRFPLLLTIGFGRHLAPERLAAIVRRHRIVHAERLAGYESQRAAWDDAGGPPRPYAAATLDFGIAYERAALGWFDGLPPEIESGSRGGVGAHGGAPVLEDTGDG